MKNPLQILNRGFSFFLLCLCMFTTTLAGHAAQYVVGWGYDSHDRISVPFGITNAVTVAAAETSLTLREDGSVIGWGLDTAGTANVPTGLTNLAAIAAGEYHTLVLKSDGTVSVWGNNNWGQTNVPVGLSNVMAVSAGWGHNLALRNDGQIYAWGYADSGRTTIPSGLSNVVAISAGGAHNLALKSDGTVTAWGANFAGQTNVPASLSNVLKIAAGQSHSIALKSDHTIIVWGNNSFGETNVPPGLTNITAIAAGEHFSLAIKSDSTLAAWGTIAEVPPGLSNVVAIAAGRLHSLAIVTVNDGSPVVTRNPGGIYSYSGTPVSFEIRAEGVPAPSCQWQFNGTNIAGATNFSLTLSNVQLANVGAYQAVVSNINGSAVSLAARLVVVNYKPYISIQPAGNPVFVGTDYSLNVSIVGSWPLAYQWRYNGTNLVGATDPSLFFNPAQLSDKGSYDVVITNSFGSVTSSVAFLNVYDLSGALNTNLVWTTAGDGLWFGENQMATYFTPAARSGSISNNQSSILQTSVSGPGTLSFQWKVSSQPILDYLKFSIDGVEQARISGESNWQTKTFFLGAGIKNIEWVYSKDATGSSGQDAAWIDSVTYTNGATIPVISTQPLNQAFVEGSNFTFNVTAYGSPQLVYQWQFNGINLVNATNTILSLTNVQSSDAGSYRVVVSNAYGSKNSSNAYLFTFVGPTHPNDAMDRWYYRDTAAVTRVRFAGGLFFGLGTNGALLTSSDGKTWTPRNSGTTAALMGVAFGSTFFGEPLFVAVGASGTILTSSNAIDWVKTNVGVADLNDVCYGDSLSGFLVAATRNTTNEPNVLISTTGTSWTGKKFSATQYGADYYCSNVTGSNGVLIASAGMPFAYDIWRSSNSGSTWQLIANSDQVVAGIARNNNRLIMVGWESWPRVSTNNGANWFASASSVITSNAYQPPFYALPMVGSDIAFGNGKFLIVRSFLRNGFLTTVDGVTWESRKIFENTSIDSVTFGNGTFVIASSGGAYPSGIYQSESVAVPFFTANYQPFPSTMNLQISGEVGRGYRLQTSTNLFDWFDYWNYTNTSGSEQFIDPVVTNSTYLFYRVVSP